MRFCLESIAASSPLVNCRLSHQTVAIATAYTECYKIQKIIMHNIWCLSVIFVTLARLGTAQSQHWHYGDEGHWPDLCQNGKLQSPIALKHDKAIRIQYSSLIFEGYNAEYQVFTKNNGHSVEVRLHTQQQPTIRGGGLPNIYVLDHLHFHWQSEHTVDNYRYPLEMHIVNYAKGYQSLEEALNYKDGVAVFAVLYDISPDDDTELNGLLSKVESVHNQINAVQTLTFNPKTHLPRDLAGYYRYNGSLTTPKCTEGVIWTVFTNTLPISSTQVSSFTTVEDEEHEKLEHNYRPLQERNARPVYLKVSPLEHSQVDADGEKSAAVMTHAVYCSVLAGFILSRL